MKQGMILLISSAAVAHKCGTAMQQELRTRVQVAESARQAAALMREHEYEVVVFDESLLETQPAAVDAVLRHADGAVPLFMNPAICGVERLVRETGAALLRRRREQRTAYDRALRNLRIELKNDITGILLGTQLAMQTAELPGDASIKLKSVCELAERLKDRLEG